MSGTWTAQNKVLPGVYMNIRTNEPLSIVPGERGTVVILQELTKGTDNTIYEITATTNEWPDSTPQEDKVLAREALKCAKTVLVYKLPSTHTSENLTAALAALKTVKFDTVCYPYDSGKETEKTAIVTWITAMRTDEGVKCQAVLANKAADSEGVLNVVQGVKMADGSALTAEQVTAWVAGATAGAEMTRSNTGARYQGAIDVDPRMTKTEMEEAVTAGKFIFKVDAAQNVTAVSDVNSFTSETPEKGKMFRKNRVVRTLDNIANDIARIFESGYVGKIDNNEDGRSLLKGALVDYFTALQNLGAVQNFEPNDVVVAAGTDTDAVVVDAHIQPVDSVEKIYITVNLA